ncbi:MAG TPA: hypothetical protein VNU03_13770 [Methylomirabilota bacterium]|nr:hypothetical protein [Methylomirabilota bacterium]
MSPCLSDDALDRVHADLGSIAERAHLAGCAACTGRSRQLRRDLDLITAVLRDTREPLTQPLTQIAPARRRWLPAAIGLSTAALALLVWVEVAVWRAVTPLPPTMQPQEVAAILSDVSASLFSVNGDPVPATGDDGPLSLEGMAREVDSTLTGGEQ